MVEISNEVLAERIEAYSKQTMASVDQVKRDISQLTQSLGRYEDHVTALGDRVTTHEKQPGHTESIFRLTQTETISLANRKDIDRLKEVFALKDEVTNLKVTVAQIQSRVEEEDAFERGRKSALSQGEKLWLVIIASIGPIVLALDRFAS